MYILKNNSTRNFIIQGKALYPGKTLEFPKLHDGELAQMLAAVNKGEIEILKKNQNTISPFKIPVKETARIGIRPMPALTHSAESPIGRILSDSPISQESIDFITARIEAELKEKKEAAAMEKELANMARIYADEMIAEEEAKVASKKAKKTSKKTVKKA